MAANITILINGPRYIERRVRRFETLSEYIDAYNSIELPSPVTLWNPNDGVSATLTVDYTAVPDIDYQILIGERSPTYLIAEDVDSQLLSRWYIMDQRRTNRGKFILNLRRDLVAEFIDPVVNSTAYIYKGFCNASNPLVFNSESLSVNEIKTGETLLYDASQCPWIVAFIARNYPGGEIVIPGEQYPAAAQYPSIESHPLYNYSNFASERQELYTSPTGNTVNINYIRTLPLLGVINSGRFSIDVKERIVQKTSVTYNPQLGYLDLNRNVNNAQSYIQDNVANLDFSSVNAYIDLPIYTGDLNPNSVFLDINSGKYYTVKLVQNTISINSEVTYKSALYEQLSTVLGEIGEEIKNPYSISYSVQQTIVVFEELQEQPYTVNLAGPSSRRHLVNDPWDAIAIPAGSFGTKSSSDAAFKIAAALIDQLQPASNGGYLFDIQYLPYCPLNTNEYNQNRAQPPGIVNLPAIFEDIQNWVEIEGFSILIWCSNLVQRLILKSGDYDIPLPHSGKNSVEQAINYKVADQTEFYRLSSPNYNGTFQFSAVKNRGVANYVVDIAYKPYNSYIRVSPAFNKSGLYGSEYRDGRGLICAGEWSLPQTGDAWMSYQIQNKTYQDQFDREVQSMDLRFDVARKREKWQIAAGAISAASSGAGAGAKIGGAAGAAIGGAGSLAASIIGGIADFTMNETLRSEEMDLAKDRFNLSLENVKARPNNLLKVSAINNNRKPVVILEKYSATDAEKIAFKNKLLFNGFTINAIGIIKDYLADSEFFLQAELVRITADADHHELSELNTELKKGVYIDGSSIND